MKKVFSIVSILCASLFCTACINNFAIQELNQMGAEYMQKGDYDNAIARFKSSVDLDENIFESRYNLAIAYISKEDYNDAIPELEYALKLKPNSLDAIYSYAVALESEGFAFEEKVFSTASDNAQIKTGPSKAEVISGLNLVLKSIPEYERFIKLSDSQTDKDRVADHIDALRDDIAKACEDYGVKVTELNINNKAE